MKVNTSAEFEGKKVLIIVENLPSPLDRRVWQEAKALRDKGMVVSIICPTGKGFDKKYEVIEDIAIYRYKLPFEANTAFGYLIEYSAAIFWWALLSLRCLFSRGFDVIHACNPPDLVFLIAIPYKLMGKIFVFDHHDINPELYLAKYNRKDMLYRMILYLERKTFDAAKVCIATNNSYKHIAVNRGGKRSDDVFVVRSGPSLEKLKNTGRDDSLKKGKQYLIGYVGVIGKQEGLTYLVDACDYIVKEKHRTDLHFICIGGGSELESIKSYARGKGVYNYFTFPGRLPDEKMNEALNTADICVNPDEYNEMNDKSTMNKIMEYMALGKPIVQFDLTEGKYSAQESSLYAKRNDYRDLAEKIISLLDDPEKRKKMGEYGYNRIKNKLDWKYEVENLYTCYRKAFDMDLN